MVTPHGIDLETDVLTCCRNMFLGDLIYFEIPLKRLLVIGSYKTAIDLFEKRSQMYSDRPGFVMTELYVIL